MTAKQAHERYQSTDVLIGALTNALADSNLVLPRPWRSLHPGTSAIETRGAPSGSLPGTQGGQPGSSPLHGGPNTVPPAYSSAQPVVTLTCFRCGAPNPSTRLYCTTCGDDLSN